METLNLLGLIGGLWAILVSVWYVFVKVSVFTKTKKDDAIVAAVQPYIDKVESLMEDLQDVKATVDTPKSDTETAAK